MLFFTSSPHFELSRGHPDTFDLSSLRAFTVTHTLTSEISLLAEPRRVVGRVRREIRRRVERGSRVEDSACEGKEGRKEGPLSCLKWRERARNERRREKM